jgi:hypothetical protein
MTYLCLDTNAWINLANGSEPARLLGAMKNALDERALTLLVPQPVIEEWDRNKEAKVNDASRINYNKLISEFEKLQGMLGCGPVNKRAGFLLQEQSDETLDFQNVITLIKQKQELVNRAITSNVKLVDELLHHQNAVIITISNEVKILTSERAVKKLAPTHSKNSMADAWIFFSFIEFVRAHSIKGAKFVSYNIDDFSVSKGQKNEIHSHLVPFLESSASEYHHIISKAFRTDFATPEELHAISRLQMLAGIEERIDYCEICSETNGHPNEVYWDHYEQEVEDERAEVDYDHDALGNLEEHPSKPKIFCYNIETGRCSWCNSEHFKCAECGSVNALWEGDYNERKECEGCGLPYLIDQEYDRDGDDRTSYKILSDATACGDCGDLFMPRWGEEHCHKCEAARNDD